MAAPPHTSPNLHNSGNHHTEGTQLNGNHIQAAGNIYFTPPSTNNAKNLLPSLVGIPFRRDTRFVDREIASKIFDRWTLPGAAVAAWGLAGNGKTYLAVECCYRAEEKFRGKRWIFWIQGTTWTTFVESFMDIASALEIDIPADLGENNSNRARQFLRHLGRCLSSQRYGQWLLVLDIPGNDLSQIATMTGFLPLSQHGSTLIITRYRTSIDLMHIEDAADVFHVGAMTPTESVALFQRKLDLEENSSLADLCLLLGQSPLAVSHVATHISRRAGHLTASQYCEELLRSIYHQEFDVDTMVTNHIYLRDHPSVTTLFSTWYDTFDSTDSVTINLLAAVTALNSLEVSEKMLLGILRHDNLEDRAYEILSNASAQDLASIGTDRDMLSMSILISLSLRKWYPGTQNLAPQTQLDWIAVSSLFKTIPISQLISLGKSPTVRSLVELGVLVDHVEAITLRNNLLPAEHEPKSIDFCIDALMVLVQFRQLSGTPRRDAEDELTRHIQLIANSPDLALRAKCTSILLWAIVARDKPDIRTYTSIARAALDICGPNALKYLGPLDLRTRNQTLKRILTATIHSVALLEGEPPGSECFQINTVLLRSVVDLMRQQSSAFADPWEAVLTQISNDMEHFKKIKRNDYPAHQQGNYLAEVIFTALHSELVLRYERRNVYLWINYRKLLLPIARRYITDKLIKDSPYRIDQSLQRQICYTTNTLYHVLVEMLHDDTIMEVITNFATFLVYFGKSAYFRRTEPIICMTDVVMHFYDRIKHSVDNPLTLKTYQDLAKAYALPLKDGAQLSRTVYQMIEKVVQGRDFT